MIRSRPWFSLSTHPHSFPTSLFFLCDLRSALLLPGLTCLLSSPELISRTHLPSIHRHVHLNPPERNTMQPNHYDLLGQGQVRNEPRRMTREDYQPLHENALQSRSPSGAAPSRTEGMPIYSSLPSSCFGSLCFDFMTLIMYILWSTFKPLLLLPCTHFAIT